MDGDVGIGTANPRSKLDVTGNIYASDVVYGSYPSGDTNWVSLAGGTYSDGVYATPNLWLETSGSVYIPGLANCDTIDTDGSGKLTCGTDDTGVGVDLYGWSFADNYFYDDGEEVIRASDEWLRLNQAGHFTSGTYTPYLLRADGGFQVDGTTVIGGDAWVEGDRIRQNTIDDSEIQDNSLTAVSLAANSVGNSELVDDITINYARGLNYIYGDYGTIARSTDEWLRLNDGSTHTNGVYIPNLLRADGGLRVGDDEGFYRDAEDVVRTDDSLKVDGNLNVGGTIYGRMSCYALKIECGGDCGLLGGTVDDKCILGVGADYRAMGVACRDVQDNTGYPDVKCDGIATCEAIPLSGSVSLGDICEDTAGWDVVITCCALK